MRTYRQLFAGKRRSWSRPRQPGMGCGLSNWQGSLTKRDAPLLGRRTGLKTLDGRGNYKAPFSHCGNLPLSSIRCGSLPLMMLMS